MSPRRTKQEIVRSDGPNILLIMSDQHRADWLGCAGADWVRTPNIDQLAKRGVRFTMATCDSPVCAPSRSALASGQRCSTIGVLSNHDLYPVDVPTYYQVLRAAGYRVGCVGKTDLHKIDHWEGAQGNRPIMYHLGFTDPMETEGKQSAGRYAMQGVCPYTHYLVENGLAKIFYEDYESRRQIWSSGDSALPLHAYHDDFVGRNACRFLQTVTDETPWHYFVSFVGPHNPWDAPKEYSSRYRPEDMPAERAIQDQMEDKPQIHRARHDEHSRDLTRERLASAMLHYSGMVSLIDDYVGSFVGILKERGLYRDTVIIYSSDHGEMMGDHGMFAKSTYFEQALRIPLLIAGPAIKTREPTDALVQLSDLAPTILELAGLGCPGNPQGQSLVPVLRGEAENARECQVSELADSRMLFDGRYKLAEHDNDQGELYDLKEDPCELRNLSRDDRAKTSEMRKRLHRLLK